MGRRARDELRRRRRGDLGELLADAVLYGFSVGVHRATRALGEARRRWRLLAELRRLPELVGVLRSLRPSAAPISGQAAAIWRLHLEQQLDDGTWVTLRDETQLAEAELLLPSGPIRVSGPALLIAPASGAFDGEQVRAALSEEQLPPAPDLRGAEHRVRSGVTVHIFGLRDTPTALSAGPFRAAARLAERAPGVTHLLFSEWSAAELQKQLRHHPELIPGGR